VTETRYGRWLGRVAVGELGVARRTGRPNALELRRRLPASTFVQGLGGLLATALVVAFGGGRALRRRPLRTKLLDLGGALVPGLAAFLVAFALLVQLCAAPRPAGALVRATLARWPSLLAGVLLVTPLASLWLRRRGARLVLHGVRREAESWAMDGLRPGFWQIVRHGFRVGVASLFAPLALSALPLIALSLLIEPLARVEGMAALTVDSLRPLDAPWLLMAILSLVPVWLAARWARSALVWALGGAHPASSPEAAKSALEATHSIVPAQPRTSAGPSPPDTAPAASPPDAPPASEAPVGAGSDARTSSG
jgi:ABC-type dipeptide/oligopeptide/nickel transport system permease component